MSEDDGELQVELSIPEPALRALVAGACYAFCELIGEEHPQQDLREATRLDMLNEIQSVGGLGFLRATIAALRATLAVALDETPDL